MTLNKGVERRKYIREKAPDAFQDASFDVIHPDEVGKFEQIVADVSLFAGQEPAPIDGGQAPDCRSARACVRRAE